MKNRQKGFINVVIAIVIIIIIAGVFAYKYDLIPQNILSGFTTPVKFKTYTHPSGAFSFHYPEEFSIIEKDKSRITLNTAEGEEILSFYPQYEPGQALPTSATAGVNILNINTYKVIKLDVPNQPIYGSKYVFAFEETNPSYFLIFEMPQPGKFFSQKYIDTILNSVSIDQNIFKTFEYKPPRS